MMYIFLSLAKPPAEGLPLHKFLDKRPDKRGEQDRQHANARYQAQLQKYNHVSHIIVV